MLRYTLSIAVTLHWNPFWLFWGTLVMFVFLSSPPPFTFPLLSPLVSWIDFSFVSDSGDAQCWFQLYGGCFIARSVFVYGGIPQFHSAHKRIPSGRAYPSILCSSAVPLMDQANIWSLTQTHHCVGSEKHTDANPVTHILMRARDTSTNHMHRKPPSQCSALSHCSKSS